MNTPYSLSLELNPKQEDIQILGDGIIQYAKEQTEHQPMEFFAVFLRDNNQSILGGCSGTILYGCLYIDYLWVSPKLRSQGYGRQLMQKALEFGLTKHCSFATVNTMDWEALAFYQKLGFSIEFQRKGFAHDSVFYFLRKSLIQPSSALENTENSRPTAISMTTEWMPTLIEANLSDYPMIQNMARFYVYDMSQYLGDEEGWECPEDGLYECIDFKKYWAEKDAFPFIIRCKNELAGFVMIDKKGSEPQIDFNVAQFFILRKFKNKGIGEYVAHQCFDRFPGTWEVMVMPGNDGAYGFWRSIIQKYTNNKFNEYTKHIKHLNDSLKNIFYFKSNQT